MLNCQRATTTTTMTTIDPINDSGQTIFGCWELSICSENNPLISSDINFLIDDCRAHAVGYAHACASAHARFRNHARTRSQSPFERNVKNLERSKCEEKVHDQAIKKIIAFSEHSNPFTWNMYRILSTFGLIMIHPLEHRWNQHIIW